MTIKYFNVKQGITTGNITLDAATGNITGGNLYANSGTVGASLLTGTLTTEAQPNITSLGTLTSLIVGNSSSNVTITVGTGNGTLTATGNITAPYFIGNVEGNISGNIVVPGTNTSVLFNNDGNAGASSNFTFDKDTSVATINGNLIVGNVYANTGTIGANLLTGTLTTAAQPNVTSLGTLTDLSVSGNTTVGGNLIVNGNLTYINVDTLKIQDPIIELGGGANGAVLTTNDGKDRGTLLHYYTTEAVNAFMGWDNSNGEFAFGSNVAINEEVISFNSLGNIRASFYLGNGSQLTGVAATTAQTVTASAQSNITSLGTLTSLTVDGVSNLGPVGNVIITGGTDGYLLSTDGSGNLTWIAPPSTTGITNGTSNVSIPDTNGNVNTSVAGTANVLVVTATGANVTGTFNATGNLIVANANLGNLATSNFFSGDGGLLSNITGANVVGSVGSATTAGTVTTNAQPNITSVGTLSSVEVSGNAIVGYALVNSGLVSNRSNVSVSTATAIDQFPPSTFRTAKYVISATSTIGYQSIEVLLVHDNTNPYITIYGSISSNNSSDIIDLTTGLNGTSGNIELIATSVSGTANVNLIASYIKS
jgi:hypothetical protein